MNTEPKVLLTIIIEGGTLHRSEKPVKKEYTIKKKDLDPKLKGKIGEEVVKRSKYLSWDLTPVDALLKTTICKEAYYYMTSTEVPEWWISFKNPKERLKEWKRMSQIKRLEVHLSKLCEHHNGKSFTYQIIED